MYGDLSVFDPGQKRIYQDYNKVLTFKKPNWKNLEKELLGRQLQVLGLEEKDKGAWVASRTKS